MILLTMQKDLIHSDEVFSGAGNEARTRLPASHKWPASICGNPASPRIQNALRAWVEVASSFLLTKKTGHPNRMSCFTLERATRLELASRHPTNGLRPFAGTLPHLRFKTRFARTGGGREFEPKTLCKKTSSIRMRSFLERATRLELATSTLARWRSTR